MFDCLLNQEACSFLIVTKLSSIKKKVGKKSVIFKIEICNNLYIYIELRGNRSIYISHIYIIKIYIIYNKKVLDHSLNYFWWGFHVSCVQEQAINQLYSWNVALQLSLEKYRRKWQKRLFSMFLRLHRKIINRIGRASIYRLTGIKYRMTVQQCRLLTMNMFLTANTYL